ncbi:hypothetical protein Tco_0085785 [Tanacetum coccineum]
MKRIDELHKFSDGTLDDVRIALNDRLKGIRMEYLPQTLWSQRDKVNARAMIRAIDKRLKTRRIMRSLERFIGQSSSDPHGFEGNLKKVVKLKYLFQDFRYSDTAHLSRSDEVLKLKNFKKDATLKLSKSSNQKWYEHVGPKVASPQDGKVSRWQRGCAWLMISKCSRSQGELPAKEQPLPPSDSPTTESPGYVTESDPEEDPEEYEDDETEDGPVDYPMDGGDEEI